MTEWHLVSERPPKESIDYLTVYNGKVGCCTLDYWNGPDPWDQYWSDGVHITHWAELPEPPKDKI